MDKNKQFIKQAIKAIDRIRKIEWLLSHAGSCSVRTMWLECVKIEIDSIERIDELSKQPMVSSLAVFNFLSTLSEMEVIASILNFFRKNSPSFRAGMNCGLKYIFFS